MRWVIAVVAVVLLAGSAVAYMGWGWSGRNSEMYGIMSEGAYEDLLAYREETGWNVMPWIDSAEDFGRAQQYHAERQRYGGFGGCHGW